LLQSGALSAMWRRRSGLWVLNRRERGAFPQSMWISVAAMHFVARGGGAEFKFFLRMMPLAVRLLLLEFLCVFDLLIAFVYFEF
jgi:hypothetical protein